MAQALANYEEELANAKMPPGKKKVLTTALKLFANNGFHGTTTAKIAKEARVSEGTIYKYFSSKEDLLISLLQPILTGIKTSFFNSLDSKQLANKHDLTALVDFIVTNRIHFIEVNFDFVRLIFQEILTGQSLNNLFQTFFAGNDGLISKLKKFQAAFPEINQDLTPQQIARIFVGPILTYILQSQLFKLPVDDADLDLIKKQILQNLTA